MEFVPPSKAYPMQALEVEELFDTVADSDGFMVEFKRPKEKARQGMVIHECRHCGYSGRAEVGSQPRPSRRAAQFCPSCRGAV